MGKISRIGIFMAAAGALGWLSACGPISLGSGGSQLIEPVPANALLISQGAIGGAVNGVTLSGTAQVYRDSSNQAILRLTGFKSPTASLFVFIETGLSQTFYVTPVAFESGSRNYPTGLSTQGQVFARVVFREAPDLFNPELGSATLIPMALTGRVQNTPDTSLPHEEGSEEF